MKTKLILLSASLALCFSARAVTFNVIVPSGTKECYVCGDFNGWNVDAAPQMSPNGENLFTLTLNDVSSVSGGFKYLCGRDWLYVEKDASGEEIDNRTTLGNPDVVGSWRSVPEYGIATEEITVNGVKRQIKVYLPDGYEEGNDSYPVIYYNTVQQRYSNAGDDNNPGDYFFGQNSWNAHSHMESLREQGHKPHILVQVCSFMGENTPEKNPEYAGTGNASQWLNSFVSELMPVVENKWRVAAGPENTTLIGADYGALFALYASITRPDVFGSCVAMSPMLWINEGVIEEMASNLDASQRFVVSAGSLEPKWMKDAAQSMAEKLSEAGASAQYVEIEGASHNDASWGRSFPQIMTVLHAPAPSKSPKMLADADFATQIYTLHSSSNKDYLATNVKGTFVYEAEYYPKGSAEPVEALVFSQEIDEKYKADYYWQIGIGEDGADGWYNSVGTIGFSSKRTMPAWQNVAILPDGSVSNVAAVCNGFTVKASVGTVAMTKLDNFNSVAVVEFPSSDKSFKINFGSVNSGSDQGALTAANSVSEACTEAEITYDFNLNKVSVKETKWGDSVVEPEFSERTYTLFGGDDKDNLEQIATFTYTTDYRKKGTTEPVEAFVATADIPVSYQSTYYWNIAKGASAADGWLLMSPKDIGFSSKKTEVSWLNVAIFPDGTTADIAAHSKGFTLHTASETVGMTQSQPHSAKATASFPGKDKTFAIHFGSVNSASDMGAVTPTLSVSEKCIEAEVTYDFNLNKVGIVETQWGENLDDVSVVALNAVPAVTVAGSDVAVSLELSAACDVEVACKKDFSTSVAVNPVKVSDTKYTLSLPSAQEGIYTFSVTLINGENRLKNAAEINVRVLPAGKKEAKKLTVNAYDGINWATTGRYKGNFHTHTSQSFDTQYSTSQVVDRYSQAGYDILALTDHDASSYPWTMFDLYNSEASPRDPGQLGMLAIPGNELSKDRRNNWSESTGGEFNHHNDFFTGRKGQEFMSLRESYAYTNAIGGLQIINHPGQYWNLSTTYKPGEKNSPEWHAENFKLYPSLIGLEVYNQGNRRPNDRILWDQILTLTMPARPVWGYSCDDTHTSEQYFRNYQFMLMPELTVDALKDAMNAGATVFSYEFTGSGEAKAPRINSISVDADKCLITVDSDDADTVEWIYSTHRTGSSPSTTQSTVIATGPTFDYSDYQGSYVRARLINQYGETATQPFGFASETSFVEAPADELAASRIIVEHDRDAHILYVSCSESIERITLLDTAGAIVRFVEGIGGETVEISTEELAHGVYIAVVATDRAAYSAKFIR